jgi:hypothetical protein
MVDKLDKFIAMLAAVNPSGNVCNPWRDWRPGIDSGPEAPALRRAYLRAYLNARLEKAEALLFAEATGYQGARFSGIAMTCERSLLGYKKWLARDLIFPNGERKRTSDTNASRYMVVQQRGFCEPTATIVWKGLLKRDGAAGKVVLWNIYPFHPHRPGEYLKNGTPTNSDILAHLCIAKAMLELFPDRPVLSVGDLSSAHLGALGVKKKDTVRHPANGGAPEFWVGLANFLNKHAVGEPHTPLTLRRR